MAEFLFSSPSVMTLNPFALWGVRKSSSKCLAALLLGSFCYGANALAQESSSTKAKISPSSVQEQKTSEDPLKFSSTPANTSSTAVKLPQDKPDNKVSGTLRLEGMKYFTVLADNPDLTYSQFLSVQFSYLGQNSWIENSVDVSAGTFFSAAQSHYAIHELYTSPKTPGVRAYIGRKINGWSEMDHNWHMGVWQPYYELDALRPEEQGLTGVFLDVNRTDFQVLGFVTPVYIPTVGAEIREDNGGLVADSRWYRSPTRRVDFTENVPNSVTYKLSVPETSKLIDHGGYGFMGRVGDKSAGPWVVSAYGYKPVNQLILKRNIKKDIANPEVGVIVSPDLTYHSVFSTDVGYTMGEVRATLSYMQDNPEAKLPDEDWAIQRLEGIRAYSANLDWNIPKLFSRSILLGVSYLKVEGGGIQDITSDGSPDDMTLADQRLKFTDAIQFKVQGELARIVRRPLVTKLAYLYDRDQKGSMINTEFQYYPSQAWAFLMGADFLGVDDSDYKTTSFLNQFRANDRVYGGMSYVF